MSAWPVVKLADVATIERSSIQAGEIDESSYYVGLENMVSGGGLADVGTAGESGVSSTKFRFDSRQVLFGKLRPYLAKIACPDFDGVCSTDIIPISPGPFLDRSYLRYFLASPDMVALATARSAGANLPRLSPNELAKFPIPLPSIDIQRQIAKVLDQVESLRAKRRAAIALLDELAQSTFLDMFGSPVDWSRNWPMTKIGRIADSVTYGTSEKASLEGEIPVLRMGNITASGGIDLSDLKYMSGAVPEKHLARSGDVLFNRTNSADLVGKTAIYRGDEPVAYAGYLVRVRVTESNHPEYLAAFMNTAYMKRVLRNMCKNIVGMANINAKELQSIDIAEPPLDLQKQFAQRVRSLEAMKVQHRRHLAELDVLFASLQDRAFRGTLWTEESAPVA